MNKITQPKITQPRSNRRIPPKSSIDGLNYSAFPTSKTIEEKYSINLKDFSVIQASTNIGTFCVLKHVQKGKEFIAKTVKQELDPLTRNFLLKHIEKLIDNPYKSILHYHGISCTDFRGANKITLLMNYYKNGSLYNLLERQRKGKEKISDTQKQIILVGVCAAMATLHDKEIKHCNLKSQNILLDEDINGFIGQNDKKCKKYLPLVADAGFYAIRMQFLPDLKEGSFSYLAPEILRSDDDKFSKESDVYAFGILMYEIISGKTPYDIEISQKNFDKLELIENIIEGKRPPYTSLKTTKELKDLIARCLSEDPKERPTFSELYIKLSNDNYELNDDDIEDDIEPQELFFKYGLKGVEIDLLNNYIDYINCNSSENNSIQLSTSQSTKNSMLESSFDSKLSISPKPPSEKVPNSTYIRSRQKNEPSSKQSSFESQKVISLQKENEELKMKIKQLEEEVKNLNKKCQNLEIENKKLKGENNNQDDNDYDDKDDVENEYSSGNDEYNSSSKDEKLNDENDQILIQLIKKVNKENTLTFKVPDNIIRIPHSLFEGCNKLREIQIPQSVKFICKRAFYNCKSLTKINVPNSVRKIGKYSFYMCESITEISLPTSMNVIKDYTFYGCKNLKTVLIPESICSIGKSAFSECTKLTEISIPKFVTSIGESVFSGCTSLKSVKIHSNCLKLIENYTFLNCASLQTLMIPPSILCIKQGSFSNCKSLKKIKIHSHVQTIESEAFSDCESLIELMIPNSVKMIGNDCFINCVNLKKVNIPPALSCIVSNTFKNCKALLDLSLPSSVISIGAGSFAGCSALKNVTFSEGLKYIKSEAFLNCTALTHLRFPKSVIDIDDDAFNGCCALTKVEYPYSMKMIINQIFYRKDISLVSY